MENILIAILAIVKIVKKNGLALVITSVVALTSVYADASFSNAEYTKVVVKNFKSNAEVKNGTTTVADFKEKKDSKIISIEVGAGDPPLKIGNITIDAGNIGVSLVKELGIYEETALRFGRDIETIRNSKYQAQYVKVIKVIDNFVTKKKISAKQGWAVLLKITNRKMFDQVFKSNTGIGKLFADAMNRDKDVKAFYQAGNLTSSTGAFNPKAFSALLAYAAKMETRHGYSAVAKTEDDDDGWGDDISFGDGTMADFEKVKKEVAETKKEGAGIHKENAELDKENTELSITLVNQYKQIVLLNGKITIEERKDVINSIATIELYQNLLKEQPDYTEKIKKHNKNVAFLKKELNITEQEIQDAVKKQKNE